MGNELFLAWMWTDLRSVFNSWSILLNMNIICYGLESNIKYSTVPIKFVCIAKHFILCMPIIYLPIVFCFVFKINYKSHLLFGSLIFTFSGIKQLNIGSLNLVFKGHKWLLLIIGKYLCRKSLAESLYYSVMIIASQMILGTRHLYHVSWAIRNQVFHWCFIECLNPILWTKRPSIFSMLWLNWKRLNSTQKHQ